jgi:GNAT superfamily N-acetyltransferase
MMSEIQNAVGEADADLAERLDKEISAFNAAASGLGARLLTAAEAEIRRRGCDRVALSTHTFQAPGFYARLGYTECGRTPGYPHGHDDIHLVKQLT